MSLEAMTAVFARTDLPPYERLVMLALADRADDELTCFPSIADICQRTGMAERGVQNVLNRLEQTGFLVIRRGGGRHTRNGYILLIGHENPARRAPIAEDKPRTRNPVSHAETPHPVPETPHAITLNPAPGAHEPSLTLIEPKEKKNAREILSSILSEEVAAAYVAHRRAKRSSLTDHAAGLIVKKLSGHPDPDAVVNESIANGWTGVFPEKTAGRSPKTNLDAAFALAMQQIEGTRQ